MIIHFCCYLIFQKAHSIYFSHIYLFKYLDEYIFTLFCCHTRTYNAGTESSNLFNLYFPNASKSRVSVLRGQVITSQGLGIVGVRVSVDRDSRFGFTLTRHGGW